jgi:hypothetical protein
VFFLKNVVFYGNLTLKRVTIYFFIWSNNMTDTSLIPAEETTPEQPIENKDNVENKPEEIGGRQGLEPTRYGDWEKGGRCIDF